MHFNYRYIILSINPASVGIGKIKMSGHRCHYCHIVLSLTNKRPPPNPKYLLRFDVLAVLLKVIFTRFSEFCVEVELLHVDQLMMLDTCKAFLIHALIKLMFYKALDDSAFIYLIIFYTLQYILKNNAKRK